MTLHRALAIEMENAIEAFERLVPEYVTSVRANSVTDRFVGEVSTIVRSIKSTLDKLANSAWVELGGKKSRHLYFPIRLTEAEFDKFVEHDLPGAFGAYPLFVEALRRHQPYNNPGASLMHVPGLYRTETHHSFTMHDTEEQQMHTLSIGPMSILTFTDNSFAVGPQFNGLRISGTKLDNQGFTSATGIYRDILFKDPRLSVMMTLLLMHNEVVAAVQDVTNAIGQPMDVTPYWLEFNAG